MTDNQNVRPEVIKNALEFIGEYSDDLKALADIESTERKQRSDTVLRRYNAFYNEECASLSTGGPISMEHMQAMALECMVDALICENMNVEYNAIAIDDIKDLIARLYEQSNEFLKRVKEFKDSADGVA